MLLTGMCRWPSTTPGKVSTSRSRNVSFCFCAKLRTCAWAKRMSSRSRLGTSPIARSISCSERRKFAGAQLSNFCDNSRTAASPCASTSERIASTVSRTLASAAFTALASIPRFKYCGIGYSMRATSLLRRLGRLFALGRWARRRKLRRIFERHHFGWRRFSRQELCPRERGEFAVLCDQLVELAALDDPPRLENKNPGGVTDGGKPMRDHERRAALHHFVERELNQALGRGVERAGRLVENEDRRIFEQCARDREALALAARKRAAALANRGAEALGMGFDEAERLRPFGRRAHLLDGGVRLADHEVVGDRAVEQQRLLEHHADVMPQTGELERAHVHAIDLDGARLRIKGAMEQCERRRLAGAGRAHQG